MSEISRDKRSADQRFHDETDERLIDFYHQTGLLELDPSALTRKEIFSVVRSAYWQGAEDFYHDRRAMLDLLAKHSTAQDQERPDRESRAA